MQSLAALSASEVDLAEVVALISQDAALSVRLLRATNSATFGLNRVVSSIRDSVVALGLDRLRQWVTLVVVADLTQADPERLSQLFIRVRCRQLFAEATKVPGNVAYVAGLLSAVAALFGEPARRLLIGLPLDSGPYRGPHHQ